MAITGRRGISCLRGIIGLGSLRMRARRWAMRWRRWRGRPRTPALDQVRSANQAASNQPVEDQMSSRVCPDGAAALLAGGPVLARRARREVDGR